MLFCFARKKTYKGDRERETDRQTKETDRQRVRDKKSGRDRKRD